MGMKIKIRMLLASRGMTIVDLAERLDPKTTRQNLDKKFKRDNMREEDLQKIAEVCNATFEGTFILNDTGKAL